MSKSFTEEEAQAKVGAKIRTQAEFSGVPSGTTGRVVKADHMGQSRIAGETAEEWDAVIEWDLPDIPHGTHTHRKPIWDWFSKDEYQQYLTEEG